MRLMKVDETQHRFTAVCYLCRKEIREQKIADLDGPSFAAYYCVPCIDTFPVQYWDTQVGT